MTHYPDQLNDVVSNESLLDDVVEPAEWYVIERVPYVVQDPDPLL